MVRDIEIELGKKKVLVGDRKLRNQKSLGDTSNFKNTNTIHPTNVSFSNESNTFHEHILLNNKRSYPLTRNTSMHEHPELESIPDGGAPGESQAVHTEFNFFPL